MSSIEFRPRFVILPVINLVVPYGLCGVLFDEFNPVRWIGLEYVAFTAFLIAALLSTLVLADH